MNYILYNLDEDMFIARDGGWIISESEVFDGDVFNINRHGSEDVCMAINIATDKTFSAVFRDFKIFTLDDEEVIWDGSEYFFSDDARDALERIIGKMVTRQYFISTSNSSTTMCNLDWPITSST